MTTTRSGQRDGWLLDHLTACGHLTETGVGRRARLRPCSRCGTLVLVGLDDDVAALEVACDPKPLTPLGEVLARLEGRRTIALHHPGRWELDARDRHAITAHPAQTRSREDVLAEHRCHEGAAQLLPAAVHAPTSFPEARPPAPAGATPNF